MKNREEAREVFKNKGLSYLDLKASEILKLQLLLKEELSLFENNGFIMKLCSLRKNDVEYAKDGSLIKCHFRVKGIIKGSNNGVYKDIIHFKEREAISFNTQNTNGDFFIGFAGWSDSNNIQPFLSAFSRFVN